uniref:Peptidase S1 domain-containing protein n=1 Tax=Panagrellus redivivus TaxID=6233 RepID=A0A7E4VWA8_PANRE
MRIATATAVVIGVVVLIGAFGSVLHSLGWRRVKRIIGGLQSTVSEDRWSFAPSLRALIVGESEFVQCGATIISKRHLLTAAHCVAFYGKVSGADIRMVDYANELWIDMRLINDINDTNRENYNITTRYYFHPSYRFQKFANDIAIVEMPEGFDFGVEPIRLAADFKEDEGEMAFTVGYGKYNPGNVTSEMRESYHLREGIFVFREAAYCSQTWAKPDIRRKLCAGEYGRGTAIGDSGGPLMKNGDDGKWYQVGICSYGRRNHSIDRKTYPGINTRISFYCPWIEEVTAGEATCHPYERQIKENPAEVLVRDRVENLSSKSPHLTALLAILLTLLPLS